MKVVINIIESLEAYRVNFVLGTFLAWSQIIVFCYSEPLRTGIVGISLVGLVPKIREYHLDSPQEASFP